jgi:RimJ/RimL family protein N-acetyltransferase
VELRNITNDDLALYEAIHCDPGMMEHLGGPFPKEGLAEKLRRDAAATEADEYWMLKIVPDPDTGTAAGTVCIWEHAMEVRTVNEIGWMVLPAFQGRGVGSGAVRSILDKARTLRRWDVVHAFPPVANARSNAMCRKMGFTLLGASDFEYRGHVLRCNDWELDLKAP